MVSMGNKTIVTKRYSIKPYSTLVTNNGRCGGTLINHLILTLLIPTAHTYHRLTLYRSSYVNYTGGSNCNQKQGKSSSGEMLPF